MKAQNPRKMTLFIILTTLVFFYGVGVCQAQEWQRKGKGEFFGAYQYMNGDDTHAHESTITVDDSSLFGFGAGYNLTDHFNLNTDFLFGSTDIKLGTDEVLKANADIFAWDVNLDYNILKERFTPFATAGLGLMNFSGNIYSFNFNETDFSYNFGAGLRWDVAKNIFLKAMYRWTFTKLEGTDDQILLEGLTVYIGILF